MNPFLIIFPIFSFLFLAFVYWLIIFKKGKGKSGELVVKTVLNKLDKKEYKILNDIKIEKYQIDHIVVSKYGIFVIETKNWSGKIYGRGWDSKWEQYVDGIGTPISSPKNPKYQNKAHIYILEKFLNEYENLPFISIIATAGELQRKIFKDPCIKISELIQVIHSYKEPLISETVRDDIYEKLSS